VFGMNVDLPFHQGVESFWVIVAAMIASLLALLGYFRYRHWL
jgi:Mg2+ and Co2+ transporter CorA